MDKREALIKVKKYKELLEKNLEIESIYLFGSYAKDNFSSDSDIDVAIIVKNINQDFFSINPYLWKIRRQVDTRIEPILIDQSSDLSGFYEEIKRSGIEVF